MFPDSSIRNFVPVLLIILVSASLAGCSAVRDENLDTLSPSDSDEKPEDALVASGSYDRLGLDYLQTSDETATGVILMVIDREQRSVLFELKDGSQVSASLALESRSWAQGCYTNSSWTNMEIIFLEEDTLTLDRVIFETPVLVANCPAAKRSVVLREYGEGFVDILPASACEHWAGAKCIFFQLEGGG